MKIKTKYILNFILNHQNNNVDILCNDRYININIL